jgi:hypothetical protein
MTGRINYMPEAEQQLQIFHGGQDWEATLRAGPSGLQES